MRFIFMILILMAAGVRGEARLSPERCELPADLNFQNAQTKLPELQQRLLKELHMHSGCALLWFNLGNVFYLREDFRHASYAFQKVIELKSELSEAAKLYLAKSKRRQGGQTTEAVLSLAELEDSKMPAPLRPELKEEKQSAYDDTIEEAMSDLQAGRNEDAEKKLIAALNLRTTGSTYAALAVALHKQGRWEREQTTLDYARELDLSSEQSRVLRALRKRLNGVDCFKAERAWRSHVDIAIGYDNNILRTNSNRQGSQTWRALVDAEKVLFVTDGYRTSVKAGATLDDYARFSSERYETLFAVNKHAFTLGNFNFILAPQVSYELYSDRPYWFRTGGFAAANFSQNGWSTGLSYEVWRNRNQSDVYPQIEGSNQNVSFDFSRQLTSTLVLRAGYSYSDFQIGDDEFGGDRIPQAYSGQGPSLGASYAFSSDWTLDASIDLQHRSFNKTILPQDQKRLDDLASLSFKTRHRLTDRFSVYAQATYLNRTSTLAEPVNSNIHATTFNTGFSWEPF